jgi:hypothetical protein
MRDPIVDHRYRHEATPPEATNPDDVDDSSEPPGDDDAEPQPPLWRTADDNVLHLPRSRVNRMFNRMPRRWRRWRRSGWGSLNPQRRATINAVGRLARSARRVGTWRSRRGGGQLPVFRSQAGGRPFRIVTRRRNGLRHEILSVEPELAGMESEFGEMQFDLDPSTGSTDAANGDQAVARLSREWSDKRRGNPPVAAMAEWLRQDRDDTLEGARLRWRKKPYAADAISRAWRISRSQQMRFQLDTASGLKSLGRFEPPREPVTLVTSRLINDSDKAPVATICVRFVEELRKRYGKFDVWNYRGHGGGSFADRGFSLDFGIPGRDERGFYPSQEAIKFLRAIDGAAKAVGAKWRVLYNDFTVADAINRETGVNHVFFMGTVRRNGKAVAGLNWHGPHPLILHFHLDLSPGA